MNQKRIRTVGELRALRTRLQAAQKPPRLVSVSAASCGRASGAMALAAALDEEIGRRGLEGSVELRLTGCHGLCQFEPNVVIFPEKIFYPNLVPEKVPWLVEETLVHGRIVPELAFRESSGSQIFPRLEDLPFLKKQVRWLLDRHLTLDPGRLESYLEHGGFMALEKVLSGISPEEVINLVQASGLRGRGGAGFPTGLKWRLARQAGQTEKYLICNGDEGDPGAYMDRGLLESNPFSIIEGMIIGGYAVGAALGFIYIRQEYPLAIERMSVALEKVREAGLLGKNILGSDFSFDLELIRGAGAFVSGEETALIASIEGRRAFPRQRPPFPVVRGLWGQPTVINNVETWANVPMIIEQGPSWFARMGTAHSKGTKIFSLVGKVRYTGLVEVPFGLTLREVIEEVGGGPEPGQRIKAVQTGGPSGGCLPASLFDLPLDYESLQKAGSIMGSGGMIVIDEATCIVDLILYFLRFAREESCGQCAPCRLGTARMVRILEKITRGEGRPEDLELLEKASWTMREASLCGLGRTAANPVLSALSYFRDELQRHVLDGECPAGVCRGLISYTIDKHRCGGCLLCLDACPAEAIEVADDGYPRIDQKLCTRCGACLTVCPADLSAVIKLNKKGAGAGEGSREE
ncbi:MAG: NADH-quinone oxidoreductase subunit NuoF [Candidatus Saccharicenans sp.]|nr:NADH-quinone oxidoreductase subunit NuoF [Candidatus Saccharicenans sp.]